MTAPRYRWPGVHGVSLQLVEQRKPPRFDPDDDAGTWAHFNRWQFRCAAVASPFVILFLVLAKS